MGHDFTEDYITSLKSQIEKLEAEVEFYKRLYFMSSPNKEEELIQATPDKMEEIISGKVPWREVRANAEKSIAEKLRKAPDGSDKTMAPDQSQ